MRTTLKGSVLALATTASAGFADGQIVYRTAALTGKPAGGPEGGMVFSGRFGTPRINDLGETVFFAEYTRGSETFGGYFSEGGFEIPMLTVRQGGPDPDPADGVARGSFLFFEVPFIDNSGRVVVYGALTDGATSGTGLFRLRPGEPMEPILRINDIPPGFDERYQVINILEESFRPSRDGTIALVARIDGPGVDESNNSICLVESRNDGFRVVAREGQQAPGLDSGLMLSGFDVPITNRSGLAAFSAELAGPNVHATNNRVLYKETADDGLVVVSRTGEPAPGTVDGETLSSFSNLRFNDLGAVGFTANLDGPNVVRTNEVGIFSDRHLNDLSLIARSGDPVPGVDDEANFFLVSAPGTFWLNNRSHVFLFAGFIGQTGDREGLFREGVNGHLSPVAIEEQQAAGFPDTTVYRDFRSYLFNDTGQTVFYGDTRGLTSPRALFASDELGRVYLIAARGMSIDVSNDPLAVDRRTVSRVSNVFFEQFFDFNQSGQIAFQAVFTDGTEGILVATLPRVRLCADADLDGIVSPGDFMAWINAFYARDPLADVDQDGVVSPTDFGAWLTAFNRGEDGPICDR